MKHLQNIYRLSLVIGKISVLRLVLEIKKFFKHQTVWANCDRRKRSCTCWNCIVTRFNGSFIGQKFTCRNRNQ